MIASPADSRGLCLSACLAQVVDPVAAAQPAARSKDLMRAMKEAAQGMRGGREVRGVGE